LFPERFVGQPDEILCVGNDRAQVPGHDRPGQHIEHAGAERVERALLPVRIDDADDNRLRALGADAARNAKRVARRSHAIEQTEHRRLVAQFGQRLLRPAGAPGREAETGKERIHGGMVALIAGDPQDG
jgi:hypothetical protein